jgi:hypothetical protein
MTQPTHRRGEEWIIPFPSLPSINHVVSSINSPITSIGQEEKEKKWKKAFPKLKCSLQVGTSHVNLPLLPSLLIYFLFVLFYFPPMDTAADSVETSSQITHLTCITINIIIFPMLSSSNKPSQLHAKSIQETPPPLVTNERTG